MSGKTRVKRLNSLLKEVISEVIFKEVKDPRMAKFLSVASVEITKDLHHAKVFISIIGTPEEKDQTLEALTSAAGFIAVQSAKQVKIRYFPSLVFKLDTTVESQMKIDEAIKKIHKQDKEQT